MGRLADLHDHAVQIEAKGRDPVSQESSSVVEACIESDRQLNGCHELIEVEVGLLVFSEVGLEVRDLGLAAYSKLDKPRANFLGSH